MVVMSLVGGCQSSTDAPTSLANKDARPRSKSIVPLPQLQKNRDGAPIPLTKTNKDREQLAMHSPIAKNIEAPLVNEQGNFLSDFNQKIKSVPKDLQEDCENYIKKIILESFRKGINIKFGNKFNKKHNINL